MKNFGNGLSVFINIARKERKARCKCAQCELCKAKSADFSALKHLSSLMRRKEVVPATVIANRLLNPEEEKIEDIIASTDKKFKAVEIEQIKSLAEKLRQCENKIEVLEVLGKISK